MADTRPDPEVTNALPTTAAQAALSGDDEDRLDRQLRRQQQQQLMTEQQRVIKERHDILANQERELGPQRRDTMAALQRQSEAGAAATQGLLERQQNIPEFKQPDIRGDAFQWMAVAAGFGAIAGALSRYHTTAALNAFGAAMKGWSAGQMQNFEENYREWQANAERAKDYNARMVGDYRAILENAKLDVDTKSNMMKLTAEKWQDQLTANAADARDIAQMENILNTQERIGDNFSLQTQKLVQTRELQITNQKIKMKSLGFAMDDEGNITIDPETGKQYEEQAQSIAHYDLAPLNTSRSGSPINRIIMERVLQIAKEEGAPYDATKFTAKNREASAEGGAVGTQAAGLKLTGRNLVSAIPKAEQLSDALPRGRWVPINQVVQQYQAGKSDPRYVLFAQQNLSIAELWARAMNPKGVMRIEDRNFALQTLSTARDPATYKQQLALLKQLVLREQGATESVRQEIISPNKPAAPPGGGGNKQDLGDGWSGTVSQ